MEGWRRSGSLVVMLDFDGTLAPIVDRADQAEMLPGARDALHRLRDAPGVRLAVVSGRDLADARARVAVDGVMYAGNHGLEIEGPGLRWVHPAAVASRPGLEAVVARLTGPLGRIPGAALEDKGLTLSVHFRRAPRDSVPVIHRLVDRTVRAIPGLGVRPGKEVLEVLPDTDWGKGRAVDLLLRHFGPPVGTPVIYIGDDRTDEDAFRAVARWLDGTGAAVMVADPPPRDTAATCFVADPGEVSALLSRLARCATAP